MHPGQMRAVGLKRALLSSVNRCFQQPERANGSLFGFSHFQRGSLGPKVSLKAGFHEQEKNL